MLKERKALDFWTRAYKDGTRILFTPAEGFTFLSTQSYWARIQQFGQFGKFGTDMPCNPPQWVYDGLEEHEDDLMVLLSQDPPKQYTPFFYHLLVLDHEAKVVEATALAGGHKIQAQGVDGGNFLLYAGKCTPKKVDVPDLPPILANIAKLQI